jgi:hypothetical protein
MAGAGWQRLSDARVGVSVAYPRGWHAAVLPPDGELVVSSARVPGGSAAAIGKLVASLRPTAALIVAYPQSTAPGSVAARKLPPRRARLVLDKVHYSSFEGFGPSYRFAFRQAGRALLVFVKLGAKASSRTRAEATSAVNSLNVVSLIKRERTIHLPGAPTDVAYGEGSVWVTSGGSASLRGWLLRLDPATGRAVARIPVPSVTDYSHIALAAGSVWVTDTGHDAVYRVDPRSRSVTTTIHLQGPALGISAGAGSLWVTAPGSTSGHGTVYRIDPATNRITARLRTSAGIGPIAFAGGSIWLINTSGPGQTLQRIDPAGNRFTRVARQLANATSVVSIAGTARYLWLGDRRFLVSRLDTRTGKLSRGISAGGNAIGAYGDLAFSVGPAGGGSTIDVATQLDTHSNEGAPVYPVGHTAVAVAVGPRAAWVANFQDATLTRIAYR